jgi:large subunit ribosomal protein L25
VRGVPRKDDMEEIVIKAEHRKVIGKKVKRLRREGKLPAIIYGRGVESIPVFLEGRMVNQVLPKVTSSSLIVLDVEGERHMALVRERQREPITGDILHVDFLEVSMTEKITTMVNLDLFGEAPAVKEYNGIIVTQQEQLEIECLPIDLIDTISVDISSLEEIGDAIYVRDVPSPPNVEILTSPDELVVVVSPPRAEEEEEEEELEELLEEEAEEPEVIERGKKEEMEEEEVE